jgi:hypothetical protein
MMSPVCHPLLALYLCTRPAQRASVHPRQQFEQEIFLDMLAEMLEGEEVE